MLVVLFERLILLCHISEDLYMNWQSMGSDEVKIQL